MKCAEIAAETKLGKLIAKTAGITLACLVALILILFGIFTIFFPSVMVEITDFCGMEKASARYAVSVYTRSNDIDDLADVVERAYYAESWSIAADYGERLSAREDFGSYCEKADASANAKPGGYAQFTAGLIAVSQYKLGNKAEALEAALTPNRQSFTENNAAVTLAMTVIADGDKDFASEILGELRGLLENINFDMEADITNLETLISVVESYCQSQA